MKYKMIFIPIILIILLICFFACKIHVSSSFQGTIINNSSIPTDNIKLHYRTECGGNKFSILVSRSGSCGSCLKQIDLSEKGKFYFGKKYFMSWMLFDVSTYTTIKIVKENQLDFNEIKNIITKQYGFADNESIEEEIKDKQFTDLYYITKSNSKNIGINKFSSTIELIDFKRRIQFSSEIISYFKKLIKDCSNQDMLNNYINVEISEYRFSKSIKIGDLVEKGFLDFDNVIGVNKNKPLDTEETYMFSYSPRDGNILIKMSGIELFSLTFPIKEKIESEKIINIDQIPNFDSTHKILTYFKPKYLMNVALNSEDEDTVKTKIAKLIAQFGLELAISNDDYPFCIHERSDVVFEEFFKCGFNPNFKLNDTLSLLKLIIEKNKYPEYEDIIINRAKILKKYGCKLTPILPGKLEEIEFARKFNLQKTVEFLEKW